MHGLRRLSCWALKCSTASPGNGRIAVALYMLYSAKKGQLGTKSDFAVCGGGGRALRRQDPAPCGGEAGVCQRGASTAHGGGSCGGLREPCGLARPYRTASLECELTFPSLSSPPTQPPTPAAPAAPAPPGRQVAHHAQAGHPDARPAAAGPQPVHHLPLRHPVPRQGHRGEPGAPQGHHHHKLRAGGQPGWVGGGRGAGGEAG